MGLSLRDTALGFFGFALNDDPRNLPNPRIAQISIRVHWRSFAVHSSWNGKERFALAANGRE
jgi:hypothetical protein